MNYSGIMYIFWNVRKCDSKQMNKLKVSSMGVYIINIILVIIYAMIYNFVKGGNKKVLFKKVLLVIVAMQFILILSAKSLDVGYDILRYGGHFYFLKTASINQFFQHGHEIGFKTLMKIISVFTSEFHVFLVLISILMIVPVIRMIYKYSNMPFLSVLIFVGFDYYYFSFSGLRQAMAYAIVCISYDYIKGRKLKSFLITIFIASTFHVSAIIFLPAYWIVNIKINKKTILLLTGINILIYQYRELIMGQLLTKFYPMYQLNYTDSYQWYAFNVLLLSISLFLYSYTTNKTMYLQQVFVLVTVGLTLLLFATVSENAMRASNYYSIFSILLFPEIIYSQKNKKVTLFLTYVFGIGIIILNVWFLLRNTYGIVPYKFIW